MAEKLKPNKSLTDRGTMEKEVQIQKLMQEAALIISLSHDKSLHKFIEEKYLKLYGWWISWSSYANGDFREENFNYSLVVSTFQYF